jgi:predicted O-methyltransferase YrrM
MSETGNSGPVNRFPIGHYYSPMYDTREIAAERARIWPPAPRDTIGIDWREQEQVALCRDVFGAQERLELAHDEDPNDPSVYYATNDQYPPLDAWVLEGFLRHLRPRRMIEIGSGWSTLVTARVNREFLGGAMDLTLVEPYPRPFLVAGVDGVRDLRTERVQDTPLELFEELGSGDILFVDTSHTVKTGGDVTWIFHEIIPRLREGVVVHIHDIYLPGEYPESWVMEGWGWNETYLAQSFLQYNATFDVLWSALLMLQRHEPEVVAAFPGLPAYRGRGGCSLWIQRSRRAPDLATRLPLTALRAIRRALGSEPQRP